MCEGASKQILDLRILPRLDRPHVLKFLDPPLYYVMYASRFLLQPNVIFFLLSTHVILGNTFEGNWQ